MALKKSRNNGKSVEQFGFDFKFNETIETISRIQADSERGDDDIAPSFINEVIQGEQNVGRANEAVGRGQTDTELTDAASGSVPAVHESGVENSGSVGAELSGAIEGAGETGRGSVTKPAAGPTEPRVAGAVGTRGAGDGGVRDTDAASDRDRTAIEAQNYVITEEDRLGTGGAKVKYRDNIAALSLLKRLEEELRSARPDEQAILVKYVGWGGIPQAFDHRNGDWSKEFRELSQLLPREDYEAARRSTQDAHYTAKPVVEAIYAGLERIGFPGGRMLEPAMGTGHFIGLMPAAMRNASKVTGIELDPTTAGIAKHLYPESTVINKGYQQVTIPSGYFDLAVGNPPFGSQSVFDAEHRELSEFSIHNYFIGKSLDKVRDGGVVAVVVSNFFMDAGNSAAREWVADRAHLLGAIRLPNTAFKENALTDVTTDIVFLKKVQEGETISKAWVNIGSVKDEESGSDIPLNQYFIENPHMLLGKMALTGTMYRNDMPTCLALPGADIKEGLARAIVNLPEGVYSKANILKEIEKGNIEIPSNVKVGAFFIANNRVARRLPDLLDHGDFEYVEHKNEKQADRIKGMIEVRTALRALMGAERSADSSGENVEELRTRLNRSYDGFIKKNGFISALSNRQAMSDDPDYPLLHSLERDYDRGISKDIAKRDGIESRDPFASKAAIFTTRVITPHRDITHVNSAKDGMLVSLNELGRIDVPYIVRLTGQTEEEVIGDLNGLIYLNPKSIGWESADQYLTGNVKKKLVEATEAAQGDRQFQANAEALLRVQPKDIEPVDIGVQLGTTWVPADVVDEFVGHLLGNVHRNISYQPTLGKWVAKIGRGDQTTATVTWGTAEVPANQLIESILIHRSIQVKDVIGHDEYRNPIYVVNAEKTAVANQKADEIRQAFSDWIWEDKTRRDRLARTYNDTFNTNVAPVYDGSHLTLPGASVTVQLRSHQKDAIWRGVQDGGGLFDHTVGAGKTFVKIGVAMESRRMGLLHKPMLAVPNHLLLQWKDAFYQLYPDAKVLIAEKTDFKKENREKLFAKIATGDWDAVIVGHSSLKKIGMPPETLNTILNEQIEDLTEALGRMKEERGDRITVKNMEKARDRMQAKLLRAASAGTKDRVVTFDELGVDALFVDESQEFKNLFINTSLNRVAGLGNLAGSDKAFDLFVKARFLQMKHDGRGVYFGTGTPISNTIAEMYTVQRYMQYDALKTQGIEHFDAWASTFGQVVTGWELDATGMNYKLNSRFAKFQNVPELIAQYRTFADVVTLADLKQQAIDEGKRFPVPKVKGGRPQNIVVDRSPLQARYIGEQEPLLDEEDKPRYREDGSLIKAWPKGCIIERMENPPKDPRIDNPLKITNDARKAGLDYRLIDPSADDFAGSKVNVMVDHIVRIHQVWDAKKGTQLVFCDLSTPKAKKGAKLDVPVVSDDDERDDVEEEASVSMDELLAGSSASGFSVYEDVKQKLIERGIPEEQIRYIHDAKTDLQKAKLFAQVNAGDVRVLIGSTAKMGAGTNVQKKLVAEHHVDAPWRPSDLEQREGRIIRQGNEFHDADPDGFEIELLRYATEKTYDSRMWQTIEYKAAGIEQFRKGDSLQRTIEDIAGEAANAAEMKAAASGNPLIFTQVKLAAELKKFEALHSNYRRNQHSLHSNIEWFEGAEGRAQLAISAVQKEIVRRDANTTEDWTFKAGKAVYTAEDKDDLLNLVLSSMQGAVETQAKKNGDEIRKFLVGQYRGFEINVHCVRNEIMFSLNGGRAYQPGNLSYMKDDKFNVSGFLHRVDNYLNAFEDEIGNVQQRLVRDRIELTKACEQVGKQFKEAEKLEQLRKDNSEILVELKKMQGDDNYVSTWTPSSERKGDVNLASDLFGDPVVKSHSADTIKRADMAVADYLRAAMLPAKTTEILGSREHDRIFEMGDGNGVAEVLMDRIDKSRDLAFAVIHGQRYASPAMLNRAQATADLYNKAETEVRKQGFTPSAPNRNEGVCVGKIISANDHFIVQDGGMQRAILHRRSDVQQGDHLKAGDSVTLSYRGGAACIKPRPDPSHSIAR